jgi:two-component system, NarL family, sensor histidine kinase UhpB
MLDVLRVLARIKDSPTLRFGALTIVPPLALFCLIIAIVVWHYRADALSDAENQSRAITSAIASRIHPYMSMDDTHALNQYLQIHKQLEKSVVGIAVSDAQGRVRASVGNTDGSSQLSRHSAPIVTHDLNSNVIRTLPSIGTPSSTEKPQPTLSQQNLGYVTVFVDTPHLLAPAHDRLIRVVLYCSLAFLLIAIGSFLYARHLAEPLPEILNSLLLIQTGQLSSAHLSNLRSGYIGTLQRSINSIVDALKSNQATIEDAVKTRTFHLTQAQAGLVQREFERSALLSRNHKLIEDERRRLSREIHDQLNADVIIVSRTIEQLLASIKRPTNGLKSISDDDLISTLEQLFELNRKVYDRARSIVRSLRIEELDVLGLDRAIRSHINTVQNAHPELNINYNSEIKGLSVVGTSAITIYRVVQECLTNVIKHANAQNVTITVSRRIESGDLFADVEDDGVGFEVEGIRDPGKLGLVGIRERAEAVGGSVSILSGRHGTLIALIVPFSSDPIDNDITDKQ